MAVGHVLASLLPEQMVEVGQLLGARDRDHPVNLKTGKKITPFGNAFPAVDHWRWMTTCNFGREAKNQIFQSEINFFPIRLPQAGKRKKKNTRGLGKVGQPWLGGHRLRNRRFGHKGHGTSSLPPSLCRGRDTACEFVNF